jgi:hypothetical protein
MHCYLQEYRALKRVPVVAANGDTGNIVAIRFREPDWGIVSIVADIGGPIHLAPAGLDYSLEEAVIRIRASEGADGEERPADEVGPLDVGADELLGRPILSSSEDDVGERVTDLLVNVREWCLRYFVLDSGKRRTLLDVGWVTGLGRDHQRAVEPRLAHGARISGPRAVDTRIRGYDLSPLHES